MAEKKHQMNRRDFLVASGGTALAGSALLASGWPNAAAAAAAPARPKPQPGVAFSDLKRGQVVANGLNRHYVELGEGPLALCLHGWPDSPYTYRYLLPELAKAGYRAVCPYQRGYYPTEAPKALTRTQDLADDVVALHEALGGDTDAVLIAHDWGTVAAYGGAAAEPHRWRRVVVMNVPPLGYMARVMFDYTQLKYEFYWWFHQMEISNQIVPANDFAYIDGIWGSWSPGYDATEDLPYTKACMRPPGHLEATLGYYRTTFNREKFGSAEANAEQMAVWGWPLPHKSLYLHGNQDGLFPLTDQQLHTELPPFFGPGSEFYMIPRVGHFMLVEDPELVNSHILRFLSS